MALNAILSIKPQYVQQILKGNKKYEYRKCIFKKDIDKIYVYSTSPQKKIVGYFEYNGYLKNNPNVLWEKTNQYSGIDKQQYNDYFKNRDIGYALIIKKFVEFKEPVDPKKIFLKFVAPQSYIYISSIIKIYEEGKV